MSVRRRVFVSGERPGVGLRRGRCVIATHTQLRLARPLVRDLRYPWEKLAPPERLTPARARPTAGLEEPLHRHPS